MRRGGAILFHLAAKWLRWRRRSVYLFNKSNLKRQQRQIRCVEDSSDQILNDAVCFESLPHWAFCKMVLLVNVVVGQLEAFIQSCPCHPSREVNQQDLAGHSWHRRHKAFISEMRSINEVAPCPMDGRRAPECAAGEF